MLKDSVSRFVTDFYPNHNKHNTIITSNTEITQSDIMNRIHIEFQKPFIRNLYRNPEWTQRVFWAVAGNLQNEYDDMDIDVSLDRITLAITKYNESY
jgi:hypothetical protein